MITVRIIAWTAVFTVVAGVAWFLGAAAQIPQLALVGCLCAMVADTLAYVSRLREEHAEGEREERERILAAEAARLARLGLVDESTRGPWAIRHPLRRRVANMLHAVGRAAVRTAATAWDWSAAALVVVGDVLSPMTTYGGAHRALVDEPTAEVELLPVDGDEWETACPDREDGQHCNHWYDGEACCACADPAAVVDEPEPVEPTTGTSEVVAREQPDLPHDDWRFDTVEWQGAFASWFDGQPDLAQVSHVRA